MFAAILLSISVVALSQFALYYWRAVLAAVAGQPVSEGVLAAARVDNRVVTGEDFETFATLHDLTPTLDPRGGGLGFVKTYYSVVNKLATMASNRLPGLASWCDQERAVCARYAAVQIDVRLAMNFEMAASYRSC
ncbi:MAG TPA: hypothetical protein VMP12_10470 [Candidatus Sulfotelmatobacter sp.]|nr:hypothetical protein [Candidatus Sulfotelmatobacter sp.]